MPLTWKDRIKVAIASGGTGTLTLGSAASGYQTFAAGDDVKLFPYVIENGTAWETGYGTYTHSGTTFARTVRKDSSSGSAIDAGTGYLYVDLIAASAPGEPFNLLGTEISVTGATTATIGAMHICTGTSADYTVTLPAASGNAGRSIGLRMGSASGLTKLVTIDGNASETIDGATTRIMWAEESAVLMCDGSNWFKIAGKSIPLTCNLKRTTDQSISSATWTACTMTSQVNGYAAMFDSGNGRVKIVRAGKYIAIAYPATAMTSSGSSYFGAALNSADASGHVAGFGLSGNWLASVPWVFDCVVDDYINACAYIVGTSTKFDGAAVPQIFVLEQPVW